MDPTQAPASADGDLSCHDLVELITEYLEGAVPADEQRRLDDHLATCAGCQAYLDQMRRTIRAAGRLSEDQIPARVRPELELAFRAWRGRR